MSTAKHAGFHKKRLIHRLEIKRDSPCIFARNSFEQSVNSFGEFASQCRLRLPNADCQTERYLIIRHSFEFSLSHFPSSRQIDREMRAYLLAIGVSFFAATAFSAELTGPAVIPAPQKMEVREGRFQLDPGARVQVDESSVATGEYLAAKLRPATGYRLPVETNGEPPKGGIQLTTKGARVELGAEGYELDVTRDGVRITAPTQAGLFYGVQTLLQLFPPQIFSPVLVTNSHWEIPFAAHIEDQPRFKWRGFMLDVSRHFFSKDEVKRVLDEMALHKLNVFHWHLTDDQGWRIEIKKYPKLTEIGAWRKQSQITPPGSEAGGDHIHPAWSAAPATAIGPEGRYGGFYTQDDIREVVAYAAARHITVVPEIEMPGHAIAALAAYPQLSCDGGNYSVNVEAGVNKGVFCVGSDEVLKFLEDVLTEVFQLFPGKYVHVGGDEVNAAVKEATWGKSASCQARMKAEGLTNLDQLQGWFTGQIGKFVTAHGKTLLGWSEIAEAPLPPNAVVMDWVGGATAAATNGHDVVMSPTKYCYFDYYQSIDTAAEPPGIGGYLPIDLVYSFEPIPAGLAPQYQSHILGGQGNLWTEYISSLAQVEYMAFPRLCALAEVDWSPKAARDWNGFSRRLQVHELRLNELGVNYRRDLSVKIGEWTSAQLVHADTNLQWDVTSDVKGVGAYRLVFEHARGAGLLIKSVSLLENGKQISTDAHAGYAARNPSKPVYVLQLPAYDANAKYTVRASVAGSGTWGTISLVAAAPGSNQP
jgi:hexosaminidase